MKKLFGLVGHPLSHSFSRKFFTDKFSREGSLEKYEYENFDLASIEELPGLINNNPFLYGLNITIPYKESVMPFLNELDEEAKNAGAVNTILIKRDDTGLFVSAKGFNTDVTGFELSLKPFLKSHHQGAMVLGSGGASKAVKYVLRKLGLPFISVSRRKDINTIVYPEITQDMIRSYPVIINTTPLGTFPDINSFPPVPYQYINSSNLLYDLVYNPAMTVFQQEGASRGAATTNGLAMLELQAEASLRIWMEGETTS